MGERRPRDPGQLWRRDERYVEAAVFGIVLLLVENEPQIVDVTVGVAELSDRETRDDLHVLPLLPVGFGRLRLLDAGLLLSKLVGHGLNRAEQIPSQYLGVLAEIRGAERV